MALNYKVTSFVWNTTDTAGTNYDVTLGFQPKCVALFATGVPGSVDTVGRGTSCVGFGFGTSDTDRRSMTMRSGDNQTSAQLSIRQSERAIFNFNGGGNSAIDGGSLDITALASWPVDGIRFVVDTQLDAGSMSFTTLNVILVAWGGSDITANLSGQFQEAGATGNATIAHGLGTTPTGALFASLSFGTAPGNIVGGGLQGSFSFGAFDGTNSWVVSGGGDDANTTMDTVSYAKTGECIALSPDPNVTTNGRASGVSFDATNITINWLERAATRYVQHIAWAGGKFTVGSTTTATNTTGFSGPTAGFIPLMALFASCCRAESTADTPTSHMQLSIGAATSASARVGQGMLDEDATANAEVTTALETDEVYANISTSSAIQGLMDVTDMTVDPMQLVMDDADPVASFVGVAMWGATATAKDHTESCKVGLSEAVFITVITNVSDTAAIRLSEVTELRATLNVADTGVVADSENAILTVQADSTDSLAMIVTHNQAADALISVSDATAVIAGEVIELRVSIDIAETVRLALAEEAHLTIRVDTADATALIAGEVVDLRVSTDVAEALRLATAEEIRISNSVDTADTTAVIAGEAIDLRVSTDIAETVRLAITEEAHLTIRVDSADTDTTGVSDAATITVSLEVTDQTAVVLGDASALLVIVAVADLLGITLSEATDLLISIAVSDRPAVIVTETGDIVDIQSDSATITAADSLAVITVETTAIAAALAVAESLPGFAEATDLRASVCPDESLRHSLTDSALIDATLALADSIAIGLTDIPAIAILVNASDVAALILGETTALVVSLTISDAARIGATELVDLMISADVTDAAVLILNESPIVDGVADVSDTIAPDTSDTPFIFATIDTAAEMLSLTVDEFARLTNELAADDQTAVIITEASEYEQFIADHPPSPEPPNAGWGNWQRISDTEFKPKLARVAKQWWR